jgi:hypothetical protein
MTTRFLSAFGSSAVLHLLTGMGALWFASAASRPAKVTPQASRATAVFVVAPTGDSEFAGLKPIDRTHDDPFIQRGDDSTTVSLGAFTFDVARIGDRARVLFPFLTPGLSLEHFALAPRREVREGLGNPFAHDVRPDAGVRRPLVLSDGALQSLIDQSWSRRDRWRAFQPIAKLADHYNADIGKLPTVLHAYLEQNGTQPYVDSTVPDPRVWLQLGLAADHVDWVGFISRYASEHPSTQATTELLFLLDNVAQGSLDTLLSLMDIDPQEDLQTTRDANGHAYDLIVDIRRYYKAELARRGLTSAEALRTHYDAARLAILTGILRTTPNGYRASDARFLIGTIYWRQQKPSDALVAWRDMTIDPSDRFVTAYSSIVTAIRDAAGPHGQNLDARQIRLILEYEHGRWVSLASDRLRHFGYRFDSF